MKKNFSLLLTSLFVAGCGCSSGGDAGHATGLPGGPTDSSYGTYEVEKLVYNYVKNEADFLAGNIDADKYCEDRDAIYPNESVIKGECKESDFAKYYEGIMKDNSVLETKINDIIKPAKDSEGTSFIIEDMDIDVDYSGLVLNPVVDPTDNTKATVSTGGINVSETFTFNLNVSLQEAILRNLLGAFYSSRGYALEADLSTPKQLTAERDVVLNHETYVLAQTDGKWLITDSKLAI